MIIFLVYLCCSVFLNVFGYKNVLLCFKYYRHQRWKQQWFVLITEQSPVKANELLLLHELNIQFKLRPGEECSDFFNVCYNYTQIFHFGLAWGVRG